MCDGDSAVQHDPRVYLCSPDRSVTIAIGEIAVDWRDSRYILPNHADWHGWLDAGWIWQVRPTESAPAICEACGGLADPACTRAGCPASAMVTVSVQAQDPPLRSSRLGTPVPPRSTGAPPP